jgi:DHA3 family macrolide efflux protein-like MFS transporter
MVSKTFFLGTLILGISSFAVGFTHVFWMFAVLMFIIGLAIPAAQTTVFTMVQEKTNPSMLGRVFSLVNIMFSGFMPLGMIIFGPLSDVIRVQTLVIACAVLIIVLGFSVRLSGRFYKEGIPKPEVNEDDVLQESADAKT